MTSALKPTVALIVHAHSEHSMTSGGLHGPKVLSIHKIMESTKGPLLDGGRLLSVGEAKQLGEMLCDPSADRTENHIIFNPSELLRETATSLTWFRPPLRTTQHWRTQDGRVQVDAVLSGLIFHVEDGVLYVAAYAGSDRPHATTPLFHAPVGNVHDDSLVCTGNATLPRSCHQSTRREWERVLLSTYFTHQNHDKVLAGGSTNESLVAFWMKRKRYKTPPDAKLLSPLGRTVATWVQGIASGRA